MRVKPHINTIDMKAMAAFGKRTALFIFLKFRQTDGAIDGIGVGFGRESENREGDENRGVEAALLGGGGGGVKGGGGLGFEVEDEAVAAAESTTAASSENVPAGVEVKANDENDDEEEDDDGAEHDLAAEGEIFEGRRSRGVGHGGFH